MSGLQLAPGKTRGFTLIELMVVVTMLAVLMLLAGPSFAGLLRQWRLTAAAETLAGDLRLARSTAIRTTRPVVLCVRDADQCGTGGDWTGGWLVFSDLDGEGDLDPGEPLIVQRGPQAGIAAITGNNTLRFRGNGSFGSAAAGINIEPRGAQASKPGLVITITALGRISVNDMDPKATAEATP